MKYVRIMFDGTPVWGELEDKTVYVLTDAPYNNGKRSGKTADFDSATLLAPCEPSKIVCVGKNYYDHIMEFGEKSEVPKNPILFIKPTTAINNPEGDIVHPNNSERVDHECELAFVIKKQAKNVSAKDAFDYILGYTCLNDVTARDIQYSDGQWTRGKCFDGFAPIGPIVTDEVDVSDLHIQTKVNGEMRQDGRTSQFMWKIPELMEFITSSMTLLPGDVVTTGTPCGISKMNRGDVCEVEIEGIGILRNRIV